MKKKGGWDPDQLLTWTMVTFGLCITLWQGWYCTHQYLAQPIRVEEQFVSLASLASLPPIQLSICRVFEIEKHEFVAQFNYFFDYEASSPFMAELVSGLPIYANSTEEFWSKLTTSSEIFQLAQLIKEIGFWNDSSASWNLIYERTTSSSLFDMGIYTFEGNSTLLCHTLRPGLASFGTKFRLITTLARKLFFI